MNALLKHNITLHVTRSGTLSSPCPSHTGQPLSSNKIRTKTFHASKGLEAECAIVINAGSFYDKRHEKPTLSCATFVALTRGQKELVVLQHYTGISREEVQDIAEPLDDTVIDIRLYRSIQARRVPFRALPPPVVRAIDCHSVFSFVDVGQLQNIIPQVIQSTCLQTALDDVEELDILTETGNQRISDYEQALVVVTPNETQTDVLSIVGDTILLAIQYFYTKQLPGTVYQVASTHTAETSIGQLLREAIATIQNSSEDHHGDQLLDCQRRLPTFACLAVCLDAALAYGDKLAMIQDFQFVVNVPVFERLDRAIQNVQKILERFPGVALHFSQSVERTCHQVRFTGTATLGLDNHSIIQLVHQPNLSPEHLFETALLGEVHEVEHVFVVNIFDGSAHELHFQEHSQSRITEIAIGVKRAEPRPACADHVFLTQHGY